jgi:hypothetical protein
VTEIATGESTLLDPPGARRALAAATWLDDDRVIAYSGAEHALVALNSRDGSMEVLMPFEPGAERTVEAIASTPDGQASVLLDDGHLVRVDLSARQVTATSDALVGSFDPANRLSYGIAPDQSSAFARFYDVDNVEDQIRVLDAGRDEVTYSGPSVAARYDAESRLHVFDEAAVGTLAGDGSLVGKTPVEIDLFAPLATDPDVTIAVTGGSVGRPIKLLDLRQQGALLGRLEVPFQENASPSAAFTVDGRSLVIAIPALDSLGLPPVLRELSMVPEDWITAACAVAARDLTEEDWARYGVGEAPGDLRCVQ